MTRFEFMQECMLRVVSNVHPENINDDVNNKIIRFVNNMTSCVYGPSEEEKAEILRQAAEDEEIRKLDEKIRKEREQRKMELKNKPKKYVLFYTCFKYSNWDDFEYKCCIKSTSLEYRDSILAYLSSYAYYLKRQDCLVPFAEYCIITENVANTLLNKSNNHSHQNKDLEYIDSDNKWLALCKEYGLERKDLKEFK